MKRIKVLVAVVLVVSFVAACAAPTPEVIEREVIVEKEVPVTVQVKEEVVVEKEVVRTVVVEKEVVVEEEYTGRPRYVLTAPIIHPYIDQWHTGGEWAADEVGGELLYFSPAGYSDAKQLEYTETSLAMPGVVGLTVMTGQADMYDGVLKEAMERGIPVTTNGACPGMKTWCDVCISTDNVPAARNVCAHLAELMGGKGKLVIASGEPAAAAHQERIEGCQQEIAENWPDVEVLGVLKDCDDAEGTVRCAETALSAYPEMTGYYGTGAMSGVGPATIFPEAGRDDILVSAVDDTPEVMEGIRTGSITFTYVQAPYAQGYLGVYVPYLMNKYGVDFPGEGCYYLDSGISFVDQSNMDTYQDTMKEHMYELIDQVEELLGVPGP